MAQPDFFGIVAAVLAVVLLVDISVLWISGKQVPELLGQLVFAVFGFYFGRAPLAPRGDEPKGKEGGGPQYSNHLRHPLIVRIEIRRPHDRGV